MYSILDTYASVKLFCLCFKIHFEHIQIFFYVLHSPHLILNWGEPCKFLKIRSNSGKITREFFDIAHGRSTRCWILLSLGVDLDKNSFVLLT